MRCGYFCPCCSGGHDGEICHAVEIIGEKPFEVDGGWGDWCDGEKANGVAQDSMIGRRLESNEESRFKDSLPTDHYSFKIILFVLNYVYKIIHIHLNKIPTHYLVY